MTLTMSWAKAQRAIGRSAHSMMRREFRLLPQAVRDVAPADTQSAVAPAILAAVLISSRDSHEHSKAARSSEAAGADAAAVPLAADPSPSARGARPNSPRKPEDDR
jgi:hypothetical protein